MDMDEVETVAMHLFAAIEVAYATHGSEAMPSRVALGQQPDRIAAAFGMAESFVEHMQARRAEARERMHEAARERGTVRPAHRYVVDGQLGI